MNFEFPEPAEDLPIFEALVLMLLMLAGLRHLSAVHEKHQVCRYYYVASVVWKL